MSKVTIHVPAGSRVTVSRRGTVRIHDHEPHPAFRPRHILANKPVQTITLMLDGVRSVLAENIPALPKTDKRRPVYEIMLSETPSGYNYRVEQLGFTNDNGFRYGHPCAWDTVSTPGAALRRAKRAAWMHHRFGKSM